MMKRSCLSLIGIILLVPLISLSSAQISESEKRLEEVSYQKLIYPTVKMGPLQHKVQSAAKNFSRVA